MESEGGFPQQQEKENTIMEHKMKTSLDSKGWSRIDEERVGYHFQVLGFKTVGEIAGLRMFELFNMNGIDNIRAWEIVRNLYLFLNKNHDADNALEYGIMDQYFPFKEWRKAFKPKNVLFRVLSNPGTTPLPANKSKPQHQKI